MTENRGSFTGKLGFVLAAAGSAVGLGNIWRFPYLAAQYGGGIFLLVYLILAVTLGFTLMTAEIAIGRKTGLSAIGAYRKLDKRFGFIGWLGSIVPMIILPYYSVIGGWVSKYLYTFVTGGMSEAAGKGYFDRFIADPIQPIGWFLLFIAVTAVVVLFGVEKGVEKVSKVMMPVLVVLTVAVAVYSLTTDGAAEGLKYYLIPNFENFSVTTILAAMGQLFYSMSLAMGIMITYGSYMKKEVSLSSSVSQIELFDTGIAFFAGLMVIPAVFSFSGPEGLGKGPGLMFDTLPKVFNSMGFAGHFVGATFFLLVLFAALTSSISLMETVVSIVRDKLGWNRRVTCLVVLLGSLLLGIPSSLGNGIWKDFTILGMDFLTFCDFITNSVLMPIVALLTCLFVGFVLKPQTLVDEVELTGPFKRRRLFSVIIKWIAPICILLILIFSVLEGFGVITV